MDDSPFPTLAHPAPLENAGSGEIPIRSAVRELEPLPLRERLRFWIILLMLILVEMSGLVWRHFLREPEVIPEDPLQVALIPPDQVPPPPPPPPPPAPPPPPPTPQQKQPLPPLDQPLQSMQPRFEPLPEPSPTLKQKESPSKLAIAKDKKEEDKPVARVGVSAPGLGAGFFDKWFYDAAKAIEAAYRSPPSERLLKEKTVVVLEFVYTNGARGQIEILRSSGDPAIDAACVAAVRDARLPPNPTSFINRAIPIRVTMPLPRQE
ncbi:MAG: Ferric siderophore transport system, periplasmic binding protein TonB [Rhodospirillales bacterium]|nr:Ferric siderophore transport system, periplasmic binding protein TonB [Rhodospirillales bacterium]